MKHEKNLRLEAEAKAKKELEIAKLNRWIEQIMDRLNSFLTKLSLPEENAKELHKQAIILALKENPDVLKVKQNEQLKKEQQKIPKADLYEEQDVINMYNDFVRTVNQRYVAQTGVTDIDMDVEAGPGGAAIDEIFSNLFEYALDSENNIIQNRERDPLSPEYKNLSLHEKLAWNRINEMEIFIKRFPTHATKGRQLRLIVDTLEKEKKISKELRDAVLLFKGSDEMLEIARNYTSDLLNKILYHV